MILIAGRAWRAQNPPSEASLGTPLARQARSKMVSFFNPADTIFRRQHHE